MSVSSTAQGPLNVIDKLRRPGLPNGNDAVLLTGTEAAELVREFDKMHKALDFISKFKIPQPGTSDEALREAVRQARGALRVRGEPFCSYCGGPWDEAHQSHWRHPE